MIADMIKMLLEGETYGDRRGAAFGLAGLVKGLGISALKAHDVMATLQAAAADKKEAHRRQGALFGFECLSERLGRLFEPYVIHILPLLLTSCSDSDDGVREAGEAASKAVMGQLSGQGVKLVMPALLQGVEDSAWKTKKAAIDLLGSMAHCAPKQVRPFLFCWYKSVHTDANGGRSWAPVCLPLCLSWRRPCRTRRRRCATPPKPRSSRSAVSLRTPRFWRFRKSSSTRYRTPKRYADVC
jgi:hypothetical protein